MSKISTFAKSPQGKKALAEAQRLAKDPETKRKIADARKRFGSGGSTGGVAKPR